MLSCKEVTRLVSESLDRELPLLDRMGVRFHLLMCRLCSRYQEQMILLRDVIRLRVEKGGQTVPPATLPPESRKRIKRSLSHDRKTGE
jgi:predicted anti-sigma-YlaC factor YlaD